MADLPDITTAVARTLQALRADRGWSLDQLAARSGVSKGVLVALEQGRSNPNLATLARIGDAFGVPLGLAAYYWVLREFDAEADWIEKAIDQHDPYGAIYLRLWYGRELRSTPRWVELMRKLNLPES